MLKREFLRWMGGMGVSGLLARQGMAGETEGKKAILPGRLKPSDLREFETLSPARRKLIERALKLGRERTLDQYLFGSADPDKGGFGCSGATYYLLKKAGLKPARSSAGQYVWIRDAKQLTPVAAGIDSLETEVFETLKAGDLLFWSGTYKPTDGRTVPITHVQMYLGREKKDGLRVMIGSSNGRSYRGVRRCGYGVFNFKLPRKGSKARFEAFGTPPGLED